MDNIKILAAVLALAGCMENGMGMEENIEINNGNVILHSADTSEWNDKIEAAGFPELESIELRGIDFDDSSDLSGLNAVVSMFDNVAFVKCKNFPKEMRLNKARNISFVLCNESLENMCETICFSCDFESLKSCSFHKLPNCSNTGNMYDYVVDYFKYTTFFVK